MSKHDFPHDEFVARRVRVCAAMAAAKLDWLVLIHPVAIHWLTGSEAKSYQAFQCLLVSSDDRLVMVTREAERAEFLDDARIDDLVTWGGPGPADPFSVLAALMRRLGMADARVGLDVPAYYLHPHDHRRLVDLLSSATVSEVTRLVPDLKMVKSARELVLIRRAAAIADLSVDALIGCLGSGRAETEVVAEIYHAILMAGGGQPATPVNFSAGPRSAFSHGAPTERRLSPGDFGNAEYAVPFRRYMVSIGRQFAIGTPSPRMRQLYDVVREAADACIAEIRAGVAASVPFEAARGVIAEAGLDDFRVHTIGYGVAPGFPPSTGEPIHLAAGSPYMLEAGMVLSICPPVFVAGERLGARLVDNVLVTETGAELLCRASRDLIVAA